MLEKYKFSPKFEKLLNFSTSKNILFLMASFFVLTFLTQFYSIDNEVIDWDESDFILMGKSFYDGYLPYIQLWDLKPPLHFILMGLSFQIFGPTLLVARLLGDFLIFLSAVLIFYITRFSLNKFDSFLTSSLYISFVSFEFSQPTMTEYTSTFFILLCIIFLFKDSKYGYFFAGVSISLSILTRTNSAFVFIFLIIYFFKKLGISKKIFNFIIGSILPLLFLVVTYTLNGALKEFLYSVFIIPLRNTLIRDNFIEFIRTYFQSIFLDSFFSLSLWALIFIFFIFIVIIKDTKLFKKNLKALDSNEFKVLMITFLALVISVLAGGRFFYHYLIQLFPFISIFIFLFLKKFIKSSNAIKFFIVLIMIVNLIPLSKESINKIQNYSEITENYKIKSFLKYIDSEKELLALDDHLIYFYLEREPITPVVHPNTIFKTEDYKYILEDLIELNYIVRDQSKIILSNYPHYILCEAECKVILPMNYLEDYKLVYSVDNLNLYEFSN